MASGTIAPASFSLMDDSIQSTVILTLNLPFLTSRRALIASCPFGSQLRQLSLAFNSRLDSGFRLLLVLARGILGCGMWMNVVAAVVVA